MDAAARKAELERLESPHVAARMAQRAKLPAFERRDELLAAVDACANVLVVSARRAAANTQLPQFVLERALASGDASVTGILCTQPRRISAISVAARVAQERGEELGESVGYQIRLEARRSAATRLFCTTGVLLRRLAVEPTLDSVSHVFVDEIHERGMNEDFLLVVLRDLLPRRPDFENRADVGDAGRGDSSHAYFGGAPVAHIPGFTYNVRTLFLEDALEAFGTRLVVSPPDARRDGFGGFGGKPGSVRWRPPGNDARIQPRRGRGRRRRARLDGGRGGRPFVGVAVASHPGIARELASSVRGDGGVGRRPGQEFGREFDRRRTRRTPTATARSSSSSPAGTRSPRLTT